ncbi:hypothetical protein [Halobacillus salinus]|uniref:Uncharacterized protein n=1 Tax=Halobacillus salinus TaxID=192814 RepID=A0A4Z0H4N2_9BACI|nr:hypothetical protein [Halobacillus salinus]TGB04155.1 hypothetical protein E4663_03880 [Halobacillus salinus]
MRKKLFNERGAALVLVLLVIVLVGIFGTVLATQINSTGMQANKSQELVQAESLAVMGENLLIKDVEKLTDLDQPLQMIRDKWDENILLKQMNSSHSYLIETKQILEKSAGEYVLPYKVTGTSEGTTKSIENELTLSSSEESWVAAIERKKEELSSKECNTNSSPPCFYFPRGLDTNKSEMYEGDLWVNDGLTIRGKKQVEVTKFLLLTSGYLTMNGSKAEIIVRGDAYISANPSKVSYLIIQGDAFFENVDVWSRVEGVCIEGQTNLVDQSGLSIGGQDCP